MGAMPRSLVVILLFSFVPQAVFAEVEISEIMYDAPGSDSKAEWIELQNTGTESVDLSKWKVSDGANHVLNAPPKNGSAGSLLLEPGGFLILASDAGTFIASNPSISVSVIDTTFNLSNDGGKLALINASSTAEDKVSYSGSKAAGTGASLQKVNGKFVEGFPTPGNPNAASKVYAPKKTVANVPLKAKTKTATKKSTKSTQRAVADPETSDPAPGDTVATSSPLAAAAVVPLDSGSHSYMPWAYGTLALGIAGASAALIARQKRKGEWDIEEIT